MRHPNGINVGAAIFTVKTLLIGAMCFSLHAAETPATTTTAQTTTPKVKTNAYWRSLGSRFQDEPNTLEKAKKIATAIATQMATDGISPNYSYVTRLESSIKYGDQQTATCGYLSEAVQAAFIGSGFRKEQTDIIVGHKRHVDRLNAGWLFDVNLNHAAPVLTIEGVPYAFDIWMHAGEFGFSGFASSVFNAIPLEAWGNMMRELTYSGFTIDSTLDPAPLLIVIGQLIDNARLIVFVVKESGKPVSGAAVKVISATIPQKKGHISHDTNSKGEAPFKELSAKNMFNDLYEVTVTAEGCQERSANIYVDLAKKWTYPIDIMKKIAISLKISAPAVADTNAPVRVSAEDDAPEAMRKFLVYEWVDNSSGETIGDRKEFTKTFVLSGTREIVLVLYYRDDNKKLTKLAEAKRAIRIRSGDDEIAKDTGPTLKEDIGTLALFKKLSMNNAYADQRGVTKNGFTFYDFDQNRFPRQGGWRQTLAQGSTPFNRRDDGNLEAMPYELWYSAETLFDELRPYELPNADGSFPSTREQFENQRRANSGYTEKMAIGDMAIATKSDAGPYQLLVSRGPITFRVNVQVRGETKRDSGWVVPDASGALWPDNRNTWPERDKLEAMVKPFVEGRRQVAIKIAESTLREVDAWLARKLGDGPGIKGLYPFNNHIERYRLAPEQAPEGFSPAADSKNPNFWNPINFQKEDKDFIISANFQMNCLGTNPGDGIRSKAEAPLRLARDQVDNCLKKIRGDKYLAPCAIEPLVLDGADSAFLVTLGKSGRPFIVARKANMYVSLEMKSRMKSGVSYREWNETEKAQYTQAAIAMMKTVFVNLSRKP